MSRVSRRPHASRKISIFICLYLRAHAHPSASNHGRLLIGAVACRRRLINCMCFGCARNNNKKTRHAYYTNTLGRDCDSFIFTIAQKRKRVNVFNGCRCRCCTRINYLLPVNESQTTCGNGGGGVGGTSLPTKVEVVAHKERCRKTSIFRLTANCEVNGDRKMLPPSPRHNENAPCSMCTNLEEMSNVHEFTRLAFDLMVTTTCGSEIP